MYHKFQNTKNVSSFNYDMSTGKLIVRFKSGRDYKYQPNGYYSGLVNLKFVFNSQTEHQITNNLRKIPFTAYNEHTA